MKLIVFIFFLLFSFTYASLPCKCRLGNFKRIIKGQYAKAHSIPWMVSLANGKDEHFCGGSILNEKYILTAAHCTNRMKLDEITVRVGVHNISQINEKRVYQVKSVIEGPYTTILNFGDFSLIELEKPIEFVPNEIEPACLDFESKNYPGDLLSAGWGVTERPWQDINDEDGPLTHESTVSDVLKYYFSSEIYDHRCPDYGICIIAKNEGDSACHGDSGSPLMYTKNGKTSIIGMASFVTNQKEGLRLYYCNGIVVYSRLSKYQHLLNQHVKKYCTV